MMGPLKRRRALWVLLPDWPQGWAVLGQFGHDVGSHPHPAGSLRAPRGIHARCTTQLATRH